jgi:hypothetical protein
MDTLMKLLGLAFGMLLSLVASAQMADNSTLAENYFNEINDDRTAPRTDLLRSEVGDFVYGPASRIKFKIIEEESGLRTTFFKIGNLPYMKSDGRQMLPHQIEDGYYLIRYYSVDNQGNQEQVRSDSIYVDRKGPNVSSSFNEVPVSYADGLPVFSKDVHLILDIKDEKVDVHHVTYRINDGERIKSENNHTIDLADALLSVNSEYVKVEVIAYDYFLNRTKEIIEFKIQR